MKLKIDKLKYACAENTQENRKLLSSICKKLGINVLPCEGYKYIEICSCDNGDSDDFEMLDTDNCEHYSRKLSHSEIVEIYKQVHNDKPTTKAPTESKEEPKQGEVWRCILLPRQYVIYLYKAHKEWDTDWVSSELLEGQAINPIQKLYTQSEVESMLNAVTTEHQEEMSALSLKESSAHETQDKMIDDIVNEWNGEGLPPVGVKCNFTPHNTRWGFNYIEDFTGTVLHYEGEQFVFMLNHTQYKLKDEMLIVSRTDKGDFSKPETPQQREERERLEAAYDLYLTQCLAGECDKFSYEEFIKEAYVVKLWLAIVDKTNYRKGV